MRNSKATHIVITMFVVTGAAFAQMASIKMDISFNSAQIQDLNNVYKCKEIVNNVNELFGDFITKNSDFSMLDELKSKIKLDELLNTNNGCPEEAMQDIKNNLESIITDISNYQNSFNESRSNIIQDIESIRDEGIEDLNSTIMTKQKARIEHITTSISTIGVKGTVPKALNINVGDKNECTFVFIEKYKDLVDDFNVFEGVHEDLFQELLRHTGEDNAFTQMNDMSITFSDNLGAWNVMSYNKTVKEEPKTAKQITQPLQNILHFKFQGKIMYNLITKHEDIHAVDADRLGKIYVTDECKVKVYKNLIEVHLEVKGKNSRILV